MRREPLRSSPRAGDRGRRTAARPAARRNLVVVGALLAAGLLGGCALPGSTHRRDAHDATSASEVQPFPASTVTWSAPERAVLPAAAALRVAVTNSSITGLELVDETGHPWPTTVQGTTAEAGDLPPARTLTATLSTIAGDGTETHTTRTIRTGDPAHPLRATITPGDGATVGVGQPIVVTFSTPVTDRAAAERALQVEADRPIGDAGWYWFDNTQVEYRPRVYWPSGTTVTVHAALAGVRAGPTTWGVRDTDVRFRIGRAQILRIDAATHQMTVVRDGATLRTVPVSLGQHKGTWRTRSGIKTIMAVERTVHMDSRTVGIDGSDAYNEDVPYAMRLTWSGEYVHGAPWSEWAQGKQDVSHGCTNVSLDNGKWLFENSLVGDPVETVGTGRPMEADNGLGGGWNLSWPAWKAGSALA